MDVADGTLMVDLEDRGVNPAADENDPRFLLEINPEGGEAVVEFRESLKFHAELAMRYEDLHPGSVTPWRQVTDSNGYLTSESEAHLTSEFARLIKDRVRSDGVGVSYASGMEFDDEPSVALSFVTEFSAEETYASWFIRIGWPVVATIINVTDPGTFNCPYVFSVLTRR